ncbi:MAG: GNAT family N-acetyltransferase [Vicinamibacterales bacterium]
MPTRLIHVRRLEDGDRERFPAMIAQAFILPPHRFEQDRQIPAEQGRLLIYNGELAASLRCERVGQFFGPSPIPTAALSAVQVLPEYRGRGLGKVLFREVLEELQTSGAAVATLFPTNVGFYRSVGFEVAGVHTRYGVPLAAIGRDPHGARVTRAASADAPAIKACYRRFAEACNGLIDRSDEWWEQRVFGQASARAVYQYVVHQGDSIGGYMVYVHDPEPRDLPYAFNVSCRDFVWLNAASARALLALAAAHPVVGVDFSWCGPVCEPMGLFINGQDMRVERSRRWMLRLVDVRHALTARRYSPTAEAAVTVCVSDPVLASNEGAYRFAVSGGCAAIERTRHGAIEIQVGTLAALYAGWITAAEANRVGLLSGATPSDIHALDTIFAATPAWMMETF